MNREEIVSQVQARQLKMLKHFDEVCKKYNIQYWGAYGTILGAARHKGFIPWDDDIDIGILREDFDKLCQVPESEWGEDYLFLTADTDDIRHDKLFARVYLKRSRIQSYGDVYGWKNYDDNRAWSTSLMLDIFVFDFVPDNKAERDKIYKTIYEKYRPRYVISKRKPITTSKSAKEKCKTFLKQMVGRSLRIIHREPWKYYSEQYTSLVTKSHKGAMIGCYATTGYYEHAFNSSENIWYYDYNDIYPLATLQFEDMELPVPNAWDKLLHLWYDGEIGDYMQFPPEDQRYHIDFVYLDFGDGTILVVDPIKGSLGENGHQ